MKYTLYFDGACRGNPGIGSYGGALYDETGTELCVYNGIVDNGEITTNNIAEYTGLLTGLLKIADEFNEIKHLIIKGDSLLIIKQLKGEFKVRNERLKQFYTDCKSIFEHFDSISFEHVLRTYNKRADSLANKALDKLIQSQKCKNKSNN